MCHLLERQAGVLPRTVARRCGRLSESSATRIKPQEIAAEQKNAWARLPRASLGYLNRRGRGISRRRAPRERGFMESRGGLRLDGENPCALRHTSVSNSGHRLTSRLTQWIRDSHSGSVMDRLPDFIRAEAGQFVATAPERATTKNRRMKGPHGPEEEAG